MAFDKKTWANNQAGGTPLDASGLNDLESRIEDEFGYMDLKIDETIQRGSNINGTYIKYANGFMDCFHQITATCEGNAAILDFTWTYPQSFISNPIVFDFPLNANGLPNIDEYTFYKVKSTQYSISLNNVRLIYFAPDYKYWTVGSTTMPVNVMARGRWK